MSIKTYTGESFGTHYFQPQIDASGLLKIDFGTFFIIRLEEMTRLMKLPVPPTRVNNHTLIYLTRGETTMKIGSETHRIHPNEGLVVPAGQVFSFDTVQDNQGYLCSVHPDFISGKFSPSERLREFDFLRVWGNPRIPLDGKTAGFMVNLLERMLIDYLQHGLTQPDVIQSYFVALLCELNRAYTTTLVAPQTNAALLANRFKELLFTHVNTHHLVADYASLLSITPNHLNKSVKAITGQSPTKWIDEAIVLEAKILLYQTNFPVSAIAAEVGIADASYFSRLFKKYAGVTPMRFRRMIETS